MECDARRIPRGVLKNLTEHDQIRIAAHIEGIGLEASMIIALFVEGFPFLFTVDPDGRVSDLGHFTAIGTGATIAYPALCQRQYNRTYTLDQAVYAVFEAKRLSEVEPSVGPDTHMFVMNKDNPESPGVLSIKADKVRAMDAVFRRYGPRKLGHDFSLPDGCLIGAKSTPKSPKRDQQAPLPSQE